MISPTRFILVKKRHLLSTFLIEIPNLYGQNFATEALLWEKKKRDTGEKAIPPHQLRSPSAPENPVGNLRKTFPTVREAEGIEKSETIFGSVTPNSKLFWGGNNVKGTILILLLHHMWHSVHFLLKALVKQHETVTKTKGVTYIQG